MFDRDMLISIEIKLFTPPVFYSENGRAVFQTTVKSAM